MTTTTVKPGAGGTLRKRLWRPFRKSPTFASGFVLVVIIVLVSIVGPWLTQIDPEYMDFVSILQPPTAAHPFGTDEFGRDILSRTVAGSRISLIVGASVTGITLVLGLVLGLISGFYARVDAVLMRVMDMLMAFPAILLAIGVMSVLGPRLENVIAALSIVYAPRSVRIVRAQVIATKQNEYVDAARALGASDARVLGRHIAMNSFAPLVVQETFIFAYAIIAEATLSFLGAGVPAGIPSWGNIISDGRAFLETSPWMIMAPGALLAITVLGVNLLGDGLRDLIDPRMRS
ncbi:MAG: ABC transporter permease [Trueperaceae bacterium]